MHDQLLDNFLIHDQSGQTCIDFCIDYICLYYNIYAYVIYS